MRKLVALLLILAVVIGCGSSKKVTRLDPGTVTDLSGNWNDTDARLVAREMISDCLSRKWITEFAAENGRKPVVTVGTIRNKSDEHIDTEVFTTDFERELINSSQVKFVASRDQRDEVRSERMDQQEAASRESVKKLREELGADYLLVGSIKTIIDQEGGKRVVFYQTDLELINIESNEKSWIGSKEIKKGIAKSGTKF